MPVSLYTFVTLTSGLIDRALGSFAIIFVVVRKT